MRDSFQVSHLDRDRDESRAVPGVVLRHVGAAGVPVGDVGVFPVNLSSEVQNFCDN